MKQVTLIGISFNHMKFQYLHVLDSPIDYEGHLPDASYELGHISNLPHP